MKKKILCLDIGFAFSPGTNQSFRALLDHILGPHYQLEFASSSDQAYAVLREDEQINLVLLGTGSPAPVSGGAVAKSISELRPDIRIIALDSAGTRGSRISMMQRENVWFYFSKKDLNSSLGALRLFRITRSLVDDPENSQWQFNFSVEDRRLTLRNQKFHIKVDITVKSRSQLNTLEACFHNPGKCVETIEVVDSATPGYSLAKVVKAVNDRVVNSTGYCTWGILNSRVCSDNAVKVLLGQKNPEQMLQTKPSDLEAELYKMKKRLATLEQWVTLCSGSMTRDRQQPDNYRQRQLYCFRESVDNGG